MDKLKQSAVYWQRLTDFAKAQNFDLGWWLVILIFFSMSVSTVLVWRSVLKDHHYNQVNNTALPDAPIKSLEVQPPTATKLTFAGSGVSLEITRILAKEFQKTHPKIKINVPASIGSSGAIQGAADGAIAVGMVSRPLKENEKKLGLKVIAIAKTPVAFAVHASVPDNNITSTQLLDIYQGKKTQWLNNREIIVLTREPGESSTLILEQKISGFKQIYADSQKDKRWTTLYKDRQMNQLLEKTPLTLGIADVGTITTEKKLSSIKTLKFNGIAPTIENVAKGKYPLVKNLYFVFIPGKTSPDAQKFMKFVRSPEGAKILAANSYLAMEEDKK